MTILKLPNEGDTLTTLVDRCAVEQGKYGDQVVSEFGGDRLYLPKLSADRQLLRCGFDQGGGSPQVDYERVGGNTLCFKRDHNSNAPDKPYWSITIADGFDIAEAKAPASKRLVETPRVERKLVSSTTRSTMANPPQPASTGRTRAKVAQAYAWCLDTAVEMQGKALPKGIMPTADSVQAGAATLIIQLEKSGLVFETLELSDAIKALNLVQKLGLDQPLPPTLNDDLPF